eukprot:5741540-Karenia_brevis.AAC.1
MAIQNAIAQWAEVIAGRKRNAKPPLACSQDPALPAARRWRCALCASVVFAWLVKLSKVRASSAADKHCCESVSLVV